MPQNFFLSSRRDCGTADWLTVDAYYGISGSQPRFFGGAAFEDLLDDNSCTGSKVRKFASSWVGLRQRTPSTPRVGLSIGAFIWNLRVVALAPFRDRKKPASQRGE